MNVIVKRLSQSLWSGGATTKQEVDSDGADNSILWMRELLKSSATRAKVYIIQLPNGALNNEVASLTPTENAPPSSPPPRCTMETRDEGCIRPTTDTLSNIANMSTAIEGESVVGSRSRQGS